MYDGPSKVGKKSPLSKPVPTAAPTVVLKQKGVSLHSISVNKPPTTEIVRVKVSECVGEPPTPETYQLNFEVVRAMGEQPLQCTIGYKALLEMLSSWADGDMSREYRLTGGAKGKAIDAAMRKWVVTGAAPDRSILIRWLLWRVEIRHYAAGQTPRLAFVCSEAAVATAEHPENDDEDHTCTDNPSPEVDDEGDVELEEPPPAYWEVVHGDEMPLSYRSNESSSVTLPPPYEEVEGLGALVDGVEEREWDMDLLRAKQRPVAVKIESKGDWSDYRWRLMMELGQSRKDLEEMRERRRRQKAVRKARQDQLLAKMNVLRHRQNAQILENRRTAQLVRDVLDLHELMGAMEMETKRVACQITRDWEQIVHYKQPYHDRRGKTMKGPVLGDGPLPYQATSRPSSSPENLASRVYCWDADGRRHKSEGSSRPKTFNEAAMRAILRLSDCGFEQHVSLRRAFAYFDRNGDGKVTLTEFATALQLLRVRPSRAELMALFGFFDPNRTGAISYGEFLAQWFQRHKLLKPPKPKVELKQQWSSSTRPTSPRAPHHAEESTPRKPRLGRSTDSSSLQSARERKQGRRPVSASPVRAPSQRDNSMSSRSTTRRVSSSDCRGPVQQESKGLETARSKLVKQVEQLHAQLDQQSYELEGIIKKTVRDSVQKTRSAAVRVADGW